MAKKVDLGPKPQPSPPVDVDNWVNGTPASTDLVAHGAGAATSRGSAHEAAPAPKTTQGTTQGTAPDGATMKRLTIDVPESLHAQIKSRCALKGVKMADEIRALLETHFLPQDEA